MTSSWESNPEFWRSAYQRHGPALMAYLTVRTRSPEEAEDLLQETFVKAIKAAHSLKDITRIRAYLFAIAHNQLINHLKKKKLISMGTANILAPDPSPEEEYLGRAFKNQLEFSMKTLSSNHRRAFELAILKGLSYHEISIKTGWSLSTVKINIYRARRQIISSMKDII
jgi:RNA polymerase sigma-70 factor (ECF subfamily)